MKQAMANDLKTRYQQEEIKKLLLCAGFLDPRLRTLDFIVCNDGNKSEEQRQLAVDTAKKMVKADIKRRMVLLDTKPQLCVVKPEPSEIPPADNHPLPSCSEINDGQSPSKKPKHEPTLFDDFFSDIMVTKVEPPTP